MVWGEDLATEHERYLAERYIRGPVVILNYPKEIKAFYMRLNDDDKNRISVPLWRLEPWQRMPRVQPYTFDHHDYVHGQPRLVDGYTVYVHDEPRSSLEVLLRAHSRVFLVVYEQGQRTQFSTELVHRFGHTPEQIGQDLLFRLH